MHFLNIKFDIYIALDGDQFLAHQNLLAIVLQGLAIGFLFYFCSVVERSFKAAELFYDFYRAFIANSGSPGNVVNRIAAQRHHVDDSLGGHTQNLLHLPSVADQIVFRRIQHQHTIIHQLQHVLAAGYNINSALLRSGFSGQCADHVVGFISGNFENRNAIGLERAPYIRNLLRQVSGHLTAVSFVLLVLLVAKRGGRHVKYRCQILRRKIVAQLAQHVYKNVNRRGWQAFARGHPTLPRHCVIRAEDERHRIDQEDAVPVLPVRRHNNRLRRRHLGFRVSNSRGLISSRQHLSLTRCARNSAGAGIINKIAAAHPFAFFAKGGNGEASDPTCGCPILSMCPNF